MEFVPLALGALLSRRRSEEDSMTRDEAFDRMRDLLRELLDDVKSFQRRPRTPPHAGQRKIA
jgi:hypothetical protein